MTQESECMVGGHISSLRKRIVQFTPGGRRGFIENKGRVSRVPGKPSKRTRLSEIDRN